VLIALGVARIDTLHGDGQLNRTFGSVGFVNVTTPEMSQNSA
jgi:hypothetical protein